MTQLITRWNPGQEDYARRVRAAFESGEPVALELPTGGGKSWGYLQGWLDAGAPPLTVSTGRIRLAEQLLTDVRAQLPDVTVALLKGQRHYRCCSYDDADAPDEPAPDDVDQPHDLADPACQYAEALRAAYAAQVVITNHAKLTVDALYNPSEGCTRVRGDAVFDDRLRRGWRVDVDAERVLILDEAHQAHELAKLVLGWDVPHVRGAVAKPVKPGWDSHTGTAAWLWSVLHPADLHGQRGLVHRDGPLGSWLRSLTAEQEPHDDRVAARLRQWRRWAEDPRYYLKVPESWLRPREPDARPPRGERPRISRVDATDELAGACDGRLRVVTSATLEPYAPWFGAIETHRYAAVFRHEQTYPVALRAPSAYRAPERRTRIADIVERLSFAEANTLVLTVSNAEAGYYVEALSRRSVRLHSDLEAYRAAASASNGNVLVGTGAALGTGVDLPGRLLTQLVVDRYPHPPGDSPERLAYEDFRRTRPELPSARVLEASAASCAVRQWIGRLIRKTTDSGVLVLCAHELEPFVEPGLFEHWASRSPSAAHP